MEPVTDIMKIQWIKVFTITDLQQRKAPKTQQDFETKIHQTILAKDEDEHEGENEGENDGENEGENEGDNEGENEKKTQPFVYKVKRKSSTNFVDITLFL